MNPGAPDQDVIDAYVNDWRHILKGVLGWDDSRFDAWVAGMRCVLNSPFLDHDHAAWYVAPLLIPEDLSRRLPDRATALRVRIARELNAGCKTAAWMATKARVSSILAGHGAELPD